MHRDFWEFLGIPSLQRSQSLHSWAGSRGISCPLLLHPFIVIPEQKSHLWFISRIPSAWFSWYSMKSALCWTAVHSLAVQEEPCSQDMECSSAHRAPSVGLNFINSVWLFESHIHTSIFQGSLQLPVGPLIPQGHTAVSGVNNEMSVRNFLRICAVGVLLSLGPSGSCWNNSASKHNEIYQSERWDYPHGYMARDEYEIHRVFICSLL